LSKLESTLRLLFRDGERPRMLPGKFWLRMLLIILKMKMLSERI